MEIRPWTVAPLGAFSGTVTKKTSAYWLVEDDQGGTVLVVAFRDVAAEINIGERVEVEPRRPVISGVRTWRVDAASIATVACTPPRRPARHWVRRALRRDVCASSCACSPFARKVIPQLTSSDYTTACFLPNDRRGRSIPHVREVITALDSVV